MRPVKGKAFLRPLPVTQPLGLVLRHTLMSVAPALRSIVDTRAIVGDLVGCAVALAQQDGLMVRSARVNETFHGLGADAVHHLQTTGS